MIEKLMEKHNGERTFFDGELVGVYFTVANLEKFAKEYHNKICSDLNVDGWVSVPIEPTYQMCAKGLVACPVFGLHINAMPHIYKAMIQAPTDKE